MITRVLAFMVSALLSVSAFAAQPAQDQFVPVKDLPTTEQLPAAPLLIAAYAFVWVAVFFYLWSIWRRLNKVDADLRTLERRATPGSSSR